MSRSFAAVFFVTLYVVAIGVVCMVNADAILRDAVVGVSLVAGLYMMFFLPTAAAGVTAVAMDGMNSSTRPTLAVGFALLLALLLQTLFATSQTQHFGPAVIEWGMVLIIGGNIALIVSYLALGVFFARRGRRSQTAT